MQLRKVEAAARRAIAAAGLDVVEDYGDELTLAGFLEVEVFIAMYEAMHKKSIELGVVATEKANETM